MIIGIPKETKPLEGRVALTPKDCVVLVDEGHNLVIEAGAGLLSGFTDEQYQLSGVTVCNTAAQLYQEASLIVKVKEPIEPDLRYLKAHHTLFCFLHLAAIPALTQQLCDIGLTAVAFECVQDQGQLPILAPMSEVAGKVAVQMGSHLLHSSLGGKGLLLGGVGNTAVGNVVVLGGGKAGLAACELAYAMGAKVTVFDKFEKPLQLARQKMPNINACIASNEAIAESLQQADLFIGAVLVAGAAAPQVVTEPMVKAMQPGSVIVDIAIDQGGCIATSKPTNYETPTFTEHGVLHVGVTNLPGAVPHTSSQALSGAILPYLKQLLQPDWREHSHLKNAINVEAGEIRLPALKE